MLVKDTMRQGHINTFFQENFNSMAFILTIDLFDLTMQNCISTHMILAPEKILQLGATALLSKTSGLPHTICDGLDGRIIDGFS